MDVSGVFLYRENQFTYHFQKTFRVGVSAVE